MFKRGMPSHRRGGYREILASALVAAALIGCGARGVSERLDARPADTGGSGGAAGSGGAPADGGAAADAAPDCTGPDAGTPAPDAGTPTPDAGNSTPDAAGASDTPDRTDAAADGSAGPVDAPSGGGTLHLSTNTLRFRATSLTVTPPPQVVTATVTGVTSGKLYITIVSVGPAVSAISNVTVTSATTGQATVFPALPSALGPGSFTSRITVTACTTDPGCSSTQLTGSPQIIDVVYDITALSVSPASVGVSAIEGSGAVFSPLDVSFSSGSVPWTAATVYTGAAAGWLAVTPASGATLPASLRLAATPLAPGTYQATVVIEGGGDSIRVPVTYTVSAPLGVAPTSVAFSGVAGQRALPPPASVAVSSVGGATTFAAGVTYGSSSSGWLKVEGTEAPGTLGIGPSTTDLPAGRHTATVSLVANGGGAAATVAVTYDLAASTLTVAPAAASFTVDNATTAAAAGLQRTITTGDTGAPLQWTARSSVPWLTVTASGSSRDPVTLGLVLSQLRLLANGTWSGNVELAYTGPGVAAATKIVPVTLTLNLSRVDFVAPYVAYVNEQLGVIVRGAGFSQATAPLTFGDLPAQSVEVRSDTEIRAVPPLLTSPGRYAVGIANALGVDRPRADLVVRAKPGYGAAVVDAAIGIQSTHLIYDAERDAVISARPFFFSGTEQLSTITRFSYEAATGTWRPTTQFFPSLFDIAFSPDGKELIVLVSTRLYRVDPVTLAANSFADLPTGDVLHRLGTASQLAVANDGKVIVRDLQTLYSLLGNTFTTLPVTTSSGFPPLFETAGIEGSPDGSRAAIGGANMTQLYYYDASTGGVLDARVSQYFVQGSFDRNARKLLAEGTVRDASFSMIGGLPPPLRGEVLSPDGARTYAYDRQAMTVRTFDVTGKGPSFPELAPFKLSVDPGVFRTAISADGSTLFFVGDKKFIVQPLP